MLVTGIITEYNPFHNGHLYHLQESKNITDAEAVICVMNGNFMQRGTPAIVDKWARTRMALNSGVDLLIELPLIFGIRSAEFFAAGAVKLLAATGIVDYLVFGSESGKIEPLQQAAEFLVKEPDYFQKSLKKYIERGLSYPRARLQAYDDYIKLTGETKKIESLQALQTPNNILGVEYIKSIIKHDFNIKPLTIKRKQAEYHSREKSGEILSATAIREIIRNNEDMSGIERAIPPVTKNLLNFEFSQGRTPVKRELLSILILSKLRELKPSDLTAYHGLSNGLEKRLWESAQKSGNLEQLISATKTKSFTWTRIQRCLLHILFGLTASELEIFANNPRYLRILGFTERGEELLSEMEKKGDLPLVIQPADCLNKINVRSSNLRIKQLSYDLLASDIYALLCPNPEARQGQRDFREKIIKV